MTVEPSASVVKADIIKKNLWSVQGHNLGLLAPICATPRKKTEASRGKDLLKVS